MKKERKNRAGRKDIKNDMKKQTKKGMMTRSCWYPSKPFSLL
jgi:hypothetical protein